MKHPALTLARQAGTQKDGRLSCSLVHNRADIDIDMYLTYSLDDTNMYVSRVYVSG